MVNLAKVVIVAGDAELTEQVCSRLRKPGFYLPVIEAPMMRLVKYGMFDADCIRVSNAVRALKPKTVLFLRLDPQVAAKLKGCFPEIQPVIVEAFDESLLLKHVKFTPKTIGYLSLLIDDSTSRSSDLFVVEGEFAVSHVIAANLAVAHEGRVISVAEVLDGEVNFLKEKSRTWSNGSQDEKRQTREAIMRFARARLPAWLLDSSDARSISFITRGVPYGVLPFRCPSTHYFSFPLLGLSVLSGMLKSQAHVRCPIVVLIDPNTVGQSEFETLRKTFGAAGYHLRLAYGGGATIQNTTYLSQFLPSDFIFFSTHCGEPDGHQIVERFPDRYGKSHEICYDRALSICPSPGSDLFEVVVLYIPISMDGVNWTDDTAKERIKAGELMEDFVQHTGANNEISDGREIITIVESKRMKGFEALKMSDGNYFPMPRMVGGCHYPVVFNNACSSWRGQSMEFGCNGASIYIGTATDVLNPVAVIVASSFAKAITSGKSIGTALFRSQKKFTEQFGYTPYLMHGYLYTSLPNPMTRLSHQRVVERLLSAIEAVKRLPDSNKHIAAQNHLEQELSGLRNITKQGGQ